MSKYFYLEISLELDPPNACDIEVLFLKKHILESLNKVFGEVGASIPVDVLKFVKNTRRFILKVPSAYYVKLYSALTLSGSYNGYDCFYKERLGPNGKDIVIFATKEDHAAPSKIELPESEPSPGLILPNGDINWNCPCLGGMATGPCGVPFREAFSCFHYSEADPKGSDCFEQFSNMQECMSKYPELYNKDDEDDDFDLDEAIQQAEEASSGKPKAENKSDSATARV